MEKRVVEEEKLYFVDVISVAESCRMLFGWVHCTRVTGAKVRTHVCICGMKQNEDSSRFHVGIVSDIQYAKKPNRVRYSDSSSPTTRTQYYIGSLNKFIDFVQFINKTNKDFHRISFVIQLGDVIDGHENNSIQSHIDFEQVLEQVNQLQTPCIHVLGNHCRNLPLNVLQKRLYCETNLHHWLGMKHWINQSQGPDEFQFYYEFQPCLGWKFLVLNGAERCKSAIDHKREDRERELEVEMKLHEADSWCGFMSMNQLDFLKESLEDARQTGDIVVIFCHYPISSKAARTRHLLGNSDHVLEILQLYGDGIVLAWIAGHDHLGGYAIQNKIHHVTLPAMLESSPNSTAFAQFTFDLNPVSLQIHGFGSVQSRFLALIKE